MKVAVIILSVLFSVAFAIRNAYQRKEAGEQNPQASKMWHLWEVVVKCCFGLVVVLFTETWFHKIFAGLMVASLDFIIFPYILNRRTGQRWDYLSNRGVDKFLRKLHPALLLFIKIVLCVVSVTYYLVNPYGN